MLGLGWVLTLHDLQRHTKLASPLLPETSCCSLALQLNKSTQIDTMNTHIAAHTNPIRVDLSTGCALHFESVVIRLLGRIQRQKVRDTAGLS